MITSCSRLPSGSTIDRILTARELAVGVEAEAWIGFVSCLELIRRQQVSAPADPDPED
jgi:hypothetical protein